MPPDTLRTLVRDCIEQHLPRHQLEIMKMAEESERSVLERFKSAAVNEIIRADDENQARNNTTVEDETDATPRAAKRRAWNKQQRRGKNGR
jgi:hypothetical protein